MRDNRGVDMFDAGGHGGPPLQPIAFRVGAVREPPVQQNLDRPDKSFFDGPLPENQPPLPPP